MHKIYFTLKRGINNRRNPKIDKPIVIYILSELIVGLVSIVGEPLPS